MSCARPWAGAEIDASRGRVEELVQTGEDGRNCKPKMEDPSGRLRLALPRTSRTPHWPAFAPAIWIMRWGAANRCEDKCFHSNLGVGIDARDYCRSRLATGKKPSSPHTSIL